MRHSRARPPRRQAEEPSHGWRPGVASQFRRRGLASRRRLLRHPSSHEARRSPSRWRGFQTSPRQASQGRARRTGNAIRQDERPRAALRERPGKRHGERESPAFRHVDDGGAIRRESARGRGEHLPVGERRERRAVGEDNAVGSRGGPATDQCYGREAQGDAAAGRYVLPREGGCVAGNGCVEGVGLRFAFGEGESRQGRAAECRRQREGMVSTLRGRGDFKRGGRG